MARKNLKTLLGSPQVIRWNKATAIKKMKEITDFPKMSVWNYGPCEYHDTPDPKCKFRACGGQPFMHQKKTAVFSYTTQRSIVANSTGTGKTLSALLTLALAHHDRKKVKALIVVPSTAVRQWEAETRRWTPGFKVATVPPKTKLQDRLNTYASDWNILIVGYHVFSLDSDKGYFKNIKVEQVIADDIDPALNTGNKTFKGLDAVTSKASMVIVMNATIIGVHLLQLYAATCLIGGRQVWGSETNFSSTYIKKEPVWIYPKPGSKGRNKWNTSTDSKGKEIRKVMQAVGYQNMGQLRAKFSPMCIRFTYEDLEDDLTIPGVFSDEIYFELTNKQRAYYDELRAGIRTIRDNKDMPVAQKAVAALAMFTYGSQVCAGTFCLKNSDGGHEPDGPDASPKLDWIMKKLHEDWPDEKVVVYAKFKGAINALQNRLHEQGIGYSTISGAVTDPILRDEAMEAFWVDDTVQVMIISVSGERSLNLQVAKVLVLWDLQLNPARLTQLAGRVRRIGSEHEKVFIFQLLMLDTQEERYTTTLSARQELFNFVFDVDNSDLSDDELIIKKMDPDEILRLISQ